MMKLKKISIIIPTRNEKDNVGKLSEMIYDVLKGIPYNIVFVDDSTDDTWECIEELRQEHPEYNIGGEHRNNGDGLAGAVIRGFSIADGDYYAVMDADLQHPPVLLKQMYCAMRRGADICIPSRFIPGGSDGGLNIWRKSVSATARYIGKIMLPCLRHISDPTGGVYMFRSEVLDGVTLKPLGWKIMIEMLARCRYNKITEIPYAFGARNAGESKLDAAVTFEYIKQVFSLVRDNSGCRPKITRWTSDRLDKEKGSLDVVIDELN